MISLPCGRSLGSFEESNFSPPTPSAMEQTPSELSSSTTLFSQSSSPWKTTPLFVSKYLGSDYITVIAKAIMNGEYTSHRCSAPLIIPYICHRNPSLVFNFCYSLDVELQDNIKNDPLLNDRVQAIFERIFNCSIILPNGKAIFVHIEAAKKASFLSKAILEQQKSHPNSLTTKLNLEEAPECLTPDRVAFILEGLYFEKWNITPEDYNLELYCIAECANFLGIDTLCTQLKQFDSAPVTPSISPVLGK